MLRIELDSVRKNRNASEWRNINRASCDGLEVTGDGWIIQQLAKRLVDAGHAPETLVSVWRGETPVFSPDSLGKWAAGRVGKEEQPEQLKSARKRNHK